MKFFMSSKNRKIAKEVFLNLDNNKFRTRSDRYYCEIGYEQEFGIEKFWCYDFLYCNVYDYRFISLFYIKYGGWIILTLIFAFIYLLCNVKDESTGLELIMLILNGLKWGSIIMLGIVTLYNFLHYKILKKFLKIHKKYKTMKWENKNREETKIINKLLESNPKLQRKLKLKNLK
jgi:hypothetical protein